jgi:hypothetical protein
MRRVALVAAVAAAALPAVASAGGVPTFVDPAPRSGWLAAPRTAPSCPTTTDRKAFPSADELYALNEKMASYGARATGSPQHRRWVRALQERLAKLPGVQLEHVDYPINRWTETKVALRVRANGGTAEKLRVAGPVPYAKPAPKGGIAAPLVYVPTGTPVAKADVRGKIVVRDAVMTSIPNAALTALQWFTYDPGGGLLAQIAESYERENNAVRVADMLDAGAAGAAGVIFLRPFPSDQVAGEYAPYEGIQWPVPSLFAGADEAARIRQLAQQGGTARITLEAQVKRVNTRMLLATLPGLSDEKLVVQSHTDGMNAVWDNGPVAMAEMAEYFASIGKQCRPRTLLFAFTTGHLYQHLVDPDRDGSAEQVAKRLDAEYDRGKVAAVFAMEHMGAKRFKVVPRGGGKPGGEIVRDGKHLETTSIFVGESPLLIADLATAVARADVKETIALRGADLPGLQIPPHANYGGEGIPYQAHLIPVVALVTQPWPLFMPAFTDTAALIDKGQLYRQTIAFTELVHTAATQPRELLGGGYLAYRAARTLVCGTALEALGLVRRCNGPLG